MEEIVSFSISVKKKYPEVVEAVKEYFIQEKWVITEEDEKNKEKNEWNYERKKRYMHWVEDVQYDSVKSVIENWGEGWKMYEDDYEMISDLAEFISEKVSDSEFSGNREYYCDVIGTVESEDFSYENGKLEEIDTSPDLDEEYEDEEEEE